MKNWCRNRWRIWKNIVEGNFSGEQYIEAAQEFIGGGDDGFFMFHSLFLFPLVVGAEHIGVPDCAYCHVPEDAAQMAVASFGDSLLTFEFPGLLNDGVNSRAILAEGISRRSVM